jgi:serine/threonine protein phosphatase PrpC
LIFKKLSHKITLSNRKKVKTPLNTPDLMQQTANMWRYLPVPATPEPHSEYDSQYAVLPGCKVTGARVRGKKHKHDGSNCDDWFEIGFVNDLTVVAVADGAGSKKFARIGAKTASQAAVSYIISSLSEINDFHKTFDFDLKKDVDSPEYSNVCGYFANIIQKSFSVAKKELEKSLNDRKNKPEYNLNRPLELADFSTTLLVSLVIPVYMEKSKENIVITVQVGDGAIAAIDTKESFDNSVKILSNTDDKSKYAGETEFINSDNVLNLNELMLRTKVYRGKADILMLMTDGVADDYFPYEDGIKRLYLDLLANMIFTNRRHVSDVKISRIIPRPSGYPWVNDSSVKIFLQYISKICESLNCSLPYIWENQGILSYYTRYVTTSKVKDRGDRLQMWLDNYVQRGSFDDRTLVILNLQ